MASSTVDVVRSIPTIVVLVNSAAGYGSGRLGEAKIPLCDIDLVHEQTTGLSAAKIEIRVAVKEFLGIPRNLREGPKTSMPVETGGFVLHSWRRFQEVVNVIVPDSPNHVNGPETSGINKFLFCFPEVLRAALLDANLNDASGLAHGADHRRTPAPVATSSAFPRRHP